MRRTLYVAVFCIFSACATQSKAPETACFDMRQAGVMKQLYDVNGENVCLIATAGFSNKYISLLSGGVSEADELSLNSGRITTDMNAKEHIRSGHDFDQPLTFQGTLTIEQIDDSCESNDCFSGSLSKTAITPYLASEKE